LEVHEGGSELARFSIVTSVVIVGDCGVLGVLETEGLTLLQEHEAEVELFLLEQDHRDDIAEFAELDGDAFVFLTGRSEEVLVDVEYLLVDVEGLLVLALLLEGFGLFFEGLYFLFECGIHFFMKFYYYILFT
jgi:hypothetical protein